MERSVLIVEDNDGVALLVKEMCADLGVRCVHIRGGSEALTFITQAIQQGKPLPDIVVLDLVLSELDGFQVANGLRALPGGDRVPLIVISGIYKRLPEAFEQTVRPLFMPKPFDPTALRHVISTALETADRAEGIKRGRFNKSSPGTLFMQLCEARATGLLDIYTADVRRRLWWQGGVIRFALSNLKGETAGGMQVVRGEIPQASFDRAVAYARQMKVPVHEALIATRIFSPEKLGDALRLQTQEVALASLLMAGADWLFTQADPERVPDAKKHPIALVLESARHHMTPDDAREAVLRMGDMVVSRTPLLDRELFGIRTTWPGETLTPLLSNPAPLVEVVARARPEDAPLLWALVTSGLLATQPRSGVHGALGATAEDPDRAKQFNAAEKQARDYIFGEVKRTESLTHYQLLGVSRTSSPEDCRRAFVQLARKYHSDAYAGLDIGSAQAALANLFQRANQAVAVLSDEKQRAEYDVFLVRQEQGLPTDAATVLRSEELFEQASRLIKLGAKGKAPQALELLDEAVKMNSADPEFRVYQAYARFWVHGTASATEAQQSIAQALEQNPDLASAYLFLGLIARETGHDTEAIRHLEKTLALDPSNERAAQELRAIRRKAEKAASGKSFISRLLGK
jgi:CheY-like chemotaxis protein